MPIPVSVSQVACPVCQGPLAPVRLRCEPCDLSIEGHFVISEFAALDPDELHFLRIFIRCEGSIREMESALGLSYPTIKSRLANLKRRLALDRDVPQSSRESSNATFKTIAEVLTALEKGEITHAQSLDHIKRLK